MATRPSSSSRLPIGAGLDTWAESSFVQARLALLGKTVFLLAFGFFAVFNAVLLVAGGLGSWPALITQRNVMHLASVSVMALLWALARLRPWSLQALGAFDVASLLLAGIGLAGMAAQPDERELMAGLFALTVTMMARAVLTRFAHGRSRSSTATSTGAMRRNVDSPSMVENTGAR